MRFSGKGDSDHCNVNVCRKEKKIDKFSFMQIRSDFQQRLLIQVKTEDLTCNALYITTDVILLYTVLKAKIKAQLAMQTLPVTDPGPAMSCTADFRCHSDKIHLIQLISTSVQTLRPKIGVSDKEDIKNVHCWVNSRTRVRNH